MAKYSFIVPVYNCETYLEECVQSILAQTVQDLEIILVDDGSTDGSGALCDHLAEKHPQLRVVHQNNGGVSVARNRGLEEAQGEYLLFVDADDTVAPIPSNVMRLLEEEKPDMVIFGMVFQYRKGERLVREEKLTAAAQYGKLYRFANRITELFDANYLSSSCNKIIKRQVVVQNGIWFDHNLINYEDLAFSVLLLSKCQTIAIDSYIGYFYQIQEGYDHTVQRIARIDDVIGNTDLIARTFLELDQAMNVPEATAPIHRIIFRIYRELFWVKIQTVGISSIRRYCRDFRDNVIIQSCLPYIKGTKNESDPVYNWIRADKSWAIWCYVRYRKMRHSVAKIVKKLLRWEKRI